MTNSKTTRLEKGLLLLWFLANLIIGALTVHEYGVSVDEPNNIQYAAVTLEAYPSLFGTRYEPAYSGTFDGHGPAFMTVASIPIRLIERLFPNVFTPDLWHFSYFLTFQLTGLCLYWLTKRWFSPWTAWGVLVLFSTQPLLLGHAFINPKDTPFMFLFTSSIVAGFSLVDHVKAGESFVSLQDPVKVVTQKFQAVDRQGKRRFLISIALALGISLGLFLFSRPINALIEQMVASFYHARPDSWAGQIFASVASSSTNISAEDYAVKAVRLLRRLKRVLLVASLLFSLTYFALLINRTSLSIVLRRLWTQRFILKAHFLGRLSSLRASPASNSLKTWFTELRRALLTPQLILAGVALGVATGVRAIAPWAGVIVLLYLFTKVRSRVWTTAIAYFLITGIVTYVAWPRLWGAPIQRYLEGLGILTNFPNYPGRVLFDGQLYNSSDLPRSYLPVLLNIQFTESFLLAA